MTTLPSPSAPTGTGEVCRPPPDFRVTRTARWLLATKARASSGVTLLRLPRRQVAGGLGLGRAPDVVELLHPVAVPPLAELAGQLQVHAGGGRLVVEGVELDDDRALLGARGDGHQAEAR